MAERSEQVMAMVESELQRNPGVSPDELYRMAQEVDPAIGELTRRQFNGRYPLQAKRKAAQGKAKPNGRKRRQTAPSVRRQRAATTQVGSTEAVEQGSRRRGRRARGEGDSGREGIRVIFLEFANAFAQADSRADVVKVMASVDGYVERVERLV